MSDPVGSLRTRRTHRAARVLPRTGRRCQLARSGTGTRAVYPAAPCSAVLALSLDPKQILDSLSPYGEIGLFLIIFAESGLLIGFFLPGDSLLFTAGLLADQGKLEPRGGRWSAASSPRSSATRSASRSASRPGRALFRRPDSRFFKQEYVERTEEFFEQHGPKTIVLARFVPVVRTFAPIARRASARCRAARSSRYNVVGAFVWAVGVTMARLRARRRHRRGHRQVPAADHRRDHHRVADPAVPRVAQGEEAPRPHAVSAAEAEAEAASSHESSTSRPSRT